ncbi:MAG: glycosyltransferase family 2 protein [Anaerovibrio sp.]
MSKYCVSIITVSYNSVGTIGKTITSVLNQTYDCLEYIIIDGGSTDGTIDIIKKYEDKISYWISEPDGGIYDAMNKGISVSNGDVIGIINSDDWYSPDTVEKAMEILNESTFDGVCGSIRYFSLLGERLNIPDVHSNPSLSEMYRRMSIAHPSVFLRKSAYQKYGGFSLDYPIAGDYELLLRMITLGAKIIYSPNIYVNFRLGGASGKHSLQSVRDVRKARYIHGVPFRVRFKCYIYDLLVNYYEIIKRMLKR